MKFPVDIQGTVFKNKTGLRKQWQHLCKTHGCKDKKERVYLKGKAREWFVETAFLSDNLRGKLYPRDTTDLQVAKDNTMVFIDRSNLGMGVACKSKIPSRHMGKTRCIFFQNKERKYQFRSVPADLGESRSNEKNVVVSWLRHQIQPQIDDFRKSQRSLAKTGGYVCQLCKKSLGKKENHVDHGAGQHSFKEIVKAFYRYMKKETLSQEDIKDPLVGKAWRSFHKTWACLSMTCKKCNLSNK